MTQTHVRHICRTAVGLGMHVMFIRDVTNAHLLFITWDGWIQKARLEYERWG